jgi:hypothetical protein
VPAAAVIPAPIAYIKIAAVKASVVGFRLLVMDAVALRSLLALSLSGLGSTGATSLYSVTLSKLECSNQAIA